MPNVNILIRIQNSVWQFCWVNMSVLRPFRNFPNVCKFDFLFGNSWFFGLLEFRVIYEKIIIPYDNKSQLIAKAKKPRFRGFLLL